MNTIKTLTSYALYTLLCLVFVSCKYECKEQDKNFRPHKVTHHHKSKTYYYYHNNPCDCYSVEDDINGAFYSCPEGKIPSFVPINYDRKKIEIVEQKQEQPITTPEIPESKTPEIPKTPKKKEEIKQNYF